MDIGKDNRTRGYADAAQQQDSDQCIACGGRVDRHGRLGCSRPDVHDAWTLLDTLITLSDLNADYSQKGQERT